MIVIIVELLWLAVGILLCFEHEEGLRKATQSRMLAGIFIFLIGAPFFLVSNVLEGFLNYILPDDWNDDDMEELR